MKSVEIYSNQFNVAGPGGQHRSLMIAHGLAKYHNYEVYLVTPKFRARYEDVVARPYEFIESGVLFDTLTKRINSYIANGITLPMRAFTDTPAIVILPSPIFRADVAAAKKFKGASVVLDFGDVWYSDNDPKMYKKLSTWYLETVVNHFVDYIVMPTKMMAEFVSRLFPAKLREKVIHIPSSIDTSIIKPHERSNRPKIAYIGSLTGRGIEMLPYIAREANRRCGDVEFTVVGSGPLKDWLKNKIQDLGLKDLLTINDPVKFHKLPEVCGDCWIGLSLVRSDAIYPVDILKSLVYMALGMPIISYIYIEEAKGALMRAQPNPSSFADAICTLVKDDSLREELSRNARQRAVELYDTKVISSKYKKLLNATG